MEFNDVSVFNDSCVMWQIHPERMNSGIVYVVSTVMAFSFRGRNGNSGGHEATGCFLKNLSI